jgi:putative ABC transport system permease protein
MTADRLVPARLRPRDVLRVGAVGLRTRPLRAFLSALGIAIGIAAMVSVVGISSSSRAEVDRMLAALGTNLLTVEPGQTFFGDDAQLPEESVSMIGRIGPVSSVSATGRVPDTAAYRSDRIPAPETNGLSVRAASLDLLPVVGGELATGTWLNAATAEYPAVVLGSAAADRLGIRRPWASSTGDGSSAGGSSAGASAAGGGSVVVRVGNREFAVVGVLKPVPLAPELDSSVLVGWPAAERYLGFDGHPTTVYTRSADQHVEGVRAVLPATANPGAPNEVQVSRPSDALAAQEATDSAFTGLLLGLGAVALLVGGVGVANTMVISVLERRAEIGLRRSLGARRGQVRTQFLAESLLLSALGGAGGVLLGIGVTAAYAGLQGWPAVVPAWATLGGVGATLVIGGLAGLYPAIRAARLAPTEALATP